MAPLFHPVSAHFGPAISDDSLNLSPAMDMATCLAGLEHNAPDADEAMDTMLDQLLH